MRIAINEVNMHFRQAKRRAEVPLGPQVVDRLLDEFEQGNHSDHQRQRLINGLNALNEEQVMLIELRYFEGRRFAEMGVLLAISEDNAKVRTYRALSALKKQSLHPMRKFKLDHTPPETPPQEDLSKYKDFGKVVTGYQKLAHDIHRKPLYKDRRLFLLVVIALLLLYLIFEAERTEKQENAPETPTSSQPFEPECGS